MVMEVRDFVRKKPEQTGTCPDTWRKVHHQQKTCTVSRNDRLYKSSRHCNCHHNRSSISAQQFTLSLDQHTYSVASPATMSSSDHVKSAKHVRDKCGSSFGRRDSLLSHIRTVGTSSRKNTTVYTSTNCGRNFDRRDKLIRHARTACTDASSPPSPKRAKREQETTPRHPLITEESIDPPARLPFADNLSTELLDVVHEHWSAIRTGVARGPLQCRFHYRLTILDTTVLEEPLKIMFKEQTHSFKTNLSYGFILSNKDTGQYRYYHYSCKWCGRYLDEPTLVTNTKDFDDFLERIRGTDVLQWAIIQRPDSVWVCELVTNVTFFINIVINHPIGRVGVTLPIYFKKNKAIISVE